ncbi:hypothetical protein CIPAW_15G070400 [Carya illinoinensis]|uniref:Uncharacterized protein n=1 Tax=Carya illinoinensis TaxID=32201 RepID=A0A8T1NA35_CARIL|nr:hypothetical protein CIPAW_15G070400 [Carya illinoinensis]
MFICSVREWFVRSFFYLAFLRFLSRWIPARLASQYQFGLYLRHQGPFGGWGAYNIFAHSVGLCRFVMCSSMGVQF